METINVKINGVDYAVPKGSTVLEAARASRQHRLVVLTVDVSPHLL